MLIELFGYSTAIDLGERFATALIKELDKRLQMNEQGEGEKRGRETKISELEVGVSYEPGDLTREALLSYTGKNSYKAGDVVSKEGSSSKDSVDVLQELEECLAMERMLIEKLNRVAIK